MLSFDAITQFFVFGRKCTFFQSESQIITKGTLNKLTNSTRRATIVAAIMVTTQKFKINSELGVSMHAQYPERNELIK